MKKIFSVLSVNSVVDSICQYEHRAAGGGDAAPGLHQTHLDPLQLARTGFAAPDRDTMFCGFRSCAL